MFKIVKLFHILFLCSKKIVMYVHNYIIFEYMKKSYTKFTVKYDSESDSIKYSARA